MILSRPFAVLLLLLVFVRPASAQSVSAADSVNGNRGDPIDQLGLDAAFVSEALIQRLMDLAEDPVDLNVGSATDLAAIPALSLPLARRIVDYRVEPGRFRTVSQLVQVPGVTPSVYESARPFLDVSPHSAAPSSTASAWQPVKVDVMQQFTRRLDLGRGFEDDTTRTTFVGSPERLVTRLKVRSGQRARFGLTLDKDPGEHLVWHPETGRYGADHVSASLSLHDLGPVTTLILGDYSASFGQGVALWRPGAFGKGRDPVGPLLRSGRAIRAKSSTEENRFFRGIALTASPFSGSSPLSSLSVSAWGSRKRRDASVDSSFVSGTVQAAVRSLSSGGYHRTPSELARKNAVQETNLGAAMRWQTSAWQVGVAGLTSRFDLPLAAGDEPVRRFDPTGNRFGVLSVFGDATTRVPSGDLHIFGELVRSASGLWGGVAGLSTTTRRTEALVFGRWYPRAFWSLHGQTLGESSGPPQNEIGVYAGAHLQIAPNWSVAAYVDAYRFPWLRYTVPRPSTGLDARLVVEHTPRPWLRQYIELRADAQDAGASFRNETGRTLDGLHREVRRSIRWHGVFKFGPSLTLRTRAEAVQAISSSPPATTASPVRIGVLLYQDIRWHPFSRLTTEARLAFFDTDDYATRVFAYEYDLLYSFSVPALQGTGQRSYLLLRMQPLDRWTVEAKYAVTHYQHVRSTGSGLNETAGSRLRSVRVQVRWRL